MNGRRRGDPPGGTTTDAPQADRQFRPSVSGLLFIGWVAVVALALAAVVFYFAGRSLEMGVRRDDTNGYVLGGVFGLFGLLMLAVGVAAAVGVRRSRYWEADARFVVTAGAVGYSGAADRPVEWGAVVEVRQASQKRALLDGPRTTAPFTLVSRTGSVYVNPNEWKSSHALVEAVYAGCQARGVPWHVVGGP